MPILEEVLLEEYDRCKRSIKAYSSRLKESPKNSTQYNQFKQNIRRVKKDIRMIHRALGPFLFLKWRKWKQEDIAYRLKTQNKE